LVTIVITIAFLLKFKWVIKTFAARKKQICFLLVKTTLSADAESYLYQVLRFAINDGEGEINYFHFTVKVPKHGITCPKIPSFLQHLNGERIF
jgi:hypothetical protein